MTAGNGRWARYGKIGAIVAVVTTTIVGAANLDGFLSLVERITGSSAPEETNTVPPQPPATSQLVVTAERPTTATNALPAAPPPAETARPRVTAAAPTAVPVPTRAGALVITIRMGSGGKVGPSEYRAGATPGANVDVYDDVGQLSSGCYPSWVLTRDGVEVQKARNGRCTSGGITMFNFNDSLGTPGNFRLSVNVVTDAGQNGSSFVDFVVR